MNKLLIRQIKKHFGSLDNLPDELKGILNDINNTYESFEDDTQLLQNSIEISSQELRNAFQKHKQDAETQKETISKIKEAISAIKPASQTGIPESETSSADSSYLFDSLIQLIEERKVADEALLESETRFRHMADHAPVLIWKSGTDTLCDYFNQTWLDFTGRTLEQEIGNGWAEGVHPDDLQHCIKTYQDSFKERRIFTMEYRLMHADGKYRWLLDNGVPRFTSQGIFTGYIGTCTDISENKRVEETLRNFSRAVEQSPVSILITDTNGNIEYGNSTVFKLTGYEPEELLDKNVRIFSSGEKSKDEYKQLWDTILSGNEWRGEFHNKNKNGDLYWEFGSISAIKNTKGEIVNFLAIKEDITERKQVTEALKESEKKYREVVENVKEVIFQTDAEGLWQFLNYAWEEITGFSVDESLGQSFVDFVHPDDRQRNLELFEPLILRKKDYCRHQIRYLTKDGGFRWIEVFARLGLNEKDEITGTYGTLQDITERKITEETLQNERNLFRTIIDLIPDAIYVKDTEGRKIIANPMEVQLAGMDSEDEVIGKTDSDLYSDIVSNYSLDDDLLILQSGKSILNQENTLINKKGEFYSISGSKVPFYDVYGKISGLVGITHDITKRKEAENALLAANKSLSDILNAAIYTSIVAADEHGIITVFSKGAEKMLGYSAEEVVGKATPALFHLESEVIERSIELTQEFGRPIEGFDVFVTKAKNQEHEERTWTFVQKNGATIQVNLVVTAIRNNNNEAIGFLGIASDITQRKEAEEAFLESSKKWEAIISSSPDGIGMVSLDGKLEFMSEKLANIYGYSIDQKDEYIGKSIFDLIDSSNHQLLTDNFQNLLSGNGEYKITEYLAVKKDNSRFYADVNSTVLYDSKGEPASILFIERDITERKQAEKALQRSETLLRSIMDTTSDVIFVKDRECRFVYINPAGCVLNGKTQEQLIGYSKADYMTNQEELAKFMADDLRIIEKGNSETFEEDILGADGRLYTFLTTKVPRFDGQGNIIGLIGMAHDITNRKKAEEALYQSNRKWEAIISASPDGIGMASLDGKLEFLSDRLASMYGFSIEQKEKYIGKTIFDFIDPSNHQILTENFQNLLMGRGENKITEYMGIKEDHSRFYADVNSTVLYDSAHNPVNILFIQRDITARKQTEQELIQAKEIAEDSEQKFRSIIQSQAEGIGFVNQNEVFEFANTASERIFETEENELVGTCLYDYLKPEARKKVDQQTHHRGEGYVNTYELQIISKKGNAKILHVTATPKLDSKNNYLGAYGVFQDITDRKKAEEEVKRVSTRLAMATLAGSIGVWEMDLTSNVLFADDQLFRLFGVEKDKISDGNESWLDKIHPEDAERISEEIQMAIRGEKQFDTEHKVCWPDGSIHNIRAMAILQYDNLGNPLRIIGVDWDITVQKTTETVLLKARQEAELANKTKSVFLANMSHEIRTPLNAIIGFSQLMNRDKYLTDSQKEYNLSIIRAGEHLLSLINDILELSKMEAGRLELNPIHVDLYLLFADIQMFFKEQIQAKHLQFIFETDVDLPQFVIVDDNKLRRIFINLIGNAIKFTDEGGIAVRVRVDKLNEFKGKLIVEIQDSGPGISETEIDKLFKHFVQTSSGINKSSGTGLGLVLSRELATLMGGDIKVTSEVGIGSVFTFCVQIEVGKAEAVQDVIKKRVVGIDKGLEEYRILVVDDTEENLQVVVKLLNLVGFTTKAALNGESAITIFEEWNPQLILMDMRMPIMDGYEATRRIKSTEKGKQIPIVALTASSFEDERNKIAELGIQGHIRKPFRESELFRTIGNILDIKYIFDDEAPFTEENYQFNDIEILEHIAKLPAKLVVEMQNAANVADIDLLIELINRIDTDNLNLAQHLMALVNNYDYEYLQRILNKKEINNE